MVDTAEDVVDAGEASEAVVDTAEEVVDAGEAPAAVVYTAEEVVDTGEAAEAVVHTAENVVDAGEAAEGLSLLVELLHTIWHFFTFNFSDVLYFSIKITISSLNLNN